MASQHLIYGIGRGLRKGYSTPEELAAYKVWQHMLERCYAPGIHKKHPTYAGVSVAPEWHDFYVFAEWYKQNYRPGCMIDKDLKYVGNKVYSPDTCVFIPQWLNNLLIDSAASRGELPIGVTRDRARFKSRFTCQGKPTYLGTFGSAVAAHHAYLKAKADHILDTLRHVTVPTAVRHSLWLVAQSMKSEVTQWA